MGSVSPFRLYIIYCGVAPVFRGISGVCCFSVMVVHNFWVGKQCWPQLLLVWLHPHCLGPEIGWQGEPRVPASSMACLCEQLFLPHMLLVACHKDGERPTHGGQRRIASAQPWRFFSVSDRRRPALLKESGKFMNRNESSPSLCLCWACDFRWSSSDTVVFSSQSNGMKGIGGWLLYLFTRRESWGLWIFPIVPYPG